MKLSSISVLFLNNQLKSCRNKYCVADRSRSFLELRISGKGKKTLAAEAAAAAAASGGLPETNKPAGSKPPVANIEIASPPQPFSQSQPAPSVITRMLQTTPGKGAFPVGRIRPKQFAMMQDSDDSDGSRPAESQEKDVAAHPAPVASHPPVSASHGSHPAGHYGESKL